MIITVIIHPNYWKLVELSLGWKTFGSWILGARSRDWLANFNTPNFILFLFSSGINKGRGPNTPNLFHSSWTGLPFLNYLYRDIFQSEHWHDELAKGLGGAQQVRHHPFSYMSKGKLLVIGKVMGFVEKIFNKRIITSQTIYEQS